MPEPVARSYPWTCAIGRHPWAKYGAVREVVESRREITSLELLDGGGYTATTTEPWEIIVHVQERVCLGCGAVQRRRVNANG